MSIEQEYFEVVDSGKESIYDNMREKYVEFIREKHGPLIGAMIVDHLDQQPNNDDLIVWMFKNL